MVMTSVWDVADPSLALATETDNPTPRLPRESAICRRKPTPGHTRARSARSQERADRLANSSRSNRARAASLCSPTSRSLPWTAANNAGAEAAGGEKAPVPPPMPLSTPTNPRPSSFARRADGPAADASHDAADPGRSLLDRESHDRQANRRRPRPSRRRGTTRPGSRVKRPTCRAATDRKPPAETSGSHSHQRTADRDACVVLAAREVRFGSPPARSSSFPRPLSRDRADLNSLAEPGAKRPLLRLRTPQAAQRSPADWIVMLDLRAGSLHLQGIDIVVPDAENLRRIALRPSACFPAPSSRMTDCTVTLAVTRPGAALFVVQPELTTRASAGLGRIVRTERGHPVAGLLHSLRRRGNCRGRPSPDRSRALQRPGQHRRQSAPRVRRRSPRARRFSGRETPPESSDCTNEGRSGAPGQHARRARGSFRHNLRRELDPQHGQPATTPCFGSTVAISSMTWETRSTGKAEKSLTTGSKPTAVMKS